MYPLILQVKTCCKQYFYLEFHSTCLAGMTICIINSCRFDNIKYYIPCQNKTRYTCVWQYFLTGVIGFKFSKPCMSSLCLILYLIAFIFLVDVVPSNPNTSFQQHKTGFYTCPVWERKQIPEVILGLIFLSVMKLRAFICNQSTIFYAEKYE